VGTVAQLPVRHLRGKCLGAAEQPPVKLCGRCRHAGPVPSTQGMAWRLFASPLGGHGRAPLGWLAAMKRVVRAQAVSEGSWRRGGLGSRHGRC
jgi:hypothetical protein